MGDEEEEETGGRKEEEGDLTKKRRSERKVNTAVNDLFVFGTDSECFLSGRSRD